MEDHRRVDPEKGGFSVHLGGTTPHTNARTTAVAC